MKTLQECKDEVARNHGYDDWRSKIYENGDNMMEMLWEEVVKMYAKEVCKEQREICTAQYNHYTSDLSIGILGRIKNAPEPKMI